MTTNDRLGTPDTTTDSPLPAWPVPIGATADPDWPSVTADGVLVRGLTWSEHDTAEVGVSVSGEQFADDGRHTKAIALYCDHPSLTAGQARALAAKLREAADALDALR